MSVSVLDLQNILVSKSGKNISFVLKLPIQSKERLLKQQENSNAGVNKKTELSGRMRKALLNL